jgi:hypothetical protein
MAFTSIKNDPCRIQKQMQEMTGLGRYMNNVPGPGTNLPFYEDPQIRLQKWGANLHTNTINLESSMIGLNQQLNRDCIQNNSKKVTTQQLQYPSLMPYVEESRAIMPPWTVLDKEQNRWDYLPLDPQKNVCFRFQNNLSTRILEKDYYKCKFRK